MRPQLPPDAAWAARRASAGSRRSRRFPPEVVRRSTFSPRPTAVPSLSAASWKLEPSPQVPSSPLPQSASPRSRLPPELIFSSTFPLQSRFGAFTFYSPPPEIQTLSGSALLADNFRRKWLFQHDPVTHTLRSLPFLLPPETQAWFQIPSQSTSAGSGPSQHLPSIRSVPFLLPCGNVSPGEEKPSVYFLSLQNRDSPRYKTGGRRSTRRKGTRGGRGRLGGGGGGREGKGHQTGRDRPHTPFPPPPPKNPKRFFYGNKKNTKGRSPAVGAEGGSGGGRGQSSRTMGSEVLAGWGGAGGGRAPPGRRGSPGFTLRDSVGRRAARRSSRWVSAFRRALGEEERSNKWGGGVVKNGNRGKLG